MSAREIGKGKWLTYGWTDGFSIGLTISKYYINLDLGFWYVGLEF